MSEIKKKELWSIRARREVNDIIEKIKDLPFIKGMMDGTLPLESFGKYIGQDIFYCEEYSISLKILSERFKDHSEDYEKTFDTFSNKCTALIPILQEEYIKKFNLKEEKKKSKICENYINFEREYSKNKSLEEGLASLLACFWVYDEIGRYMYANQIQGKNIYKIWMDDYANGPSKSLEKYLKICNDIAEKNPNYDEKMIQTYRMAVQFEYDFWDDCF